MHHLLEHLRPHLSSAAGFAATTLSAETATSDPDPGRSFLMFTLSLTIAIMTIVHLALQIREHVHRRQRHR